MPTSERWHISDTGWSAMPSGVRQLTHGQVLDVLDWVGREDQQKEVQMTTATIPGVQGTPGPFPYQYGQPHGYARDITSAAGNCVCGFPLAEARHVEAAPDQAEGTTHVLMVVDMSGSMSGLEEDVRGGYNTFLQGLEGDGNFRITSTRFDHRYMPLCVDEPVASAPLLTRINYAPAGNTALLDAVGRTILDFEARVPALGVADKVMLVIQTDGHENASTEHTAESVKKLITERTVEGSKWSVMYIGAGMDTWAQAKSMGLRANSYVQTSGSRGATRTTYSGLSAATRAYSKGASGDDAAEVVRGATEGL